MVGSSAFCQVSLGTIVSDILPELDLLQLANHPRRQTKAIRNAVTAA